MQWHIEFVIPAKRLSDALALVHGLKGASNIGCRRVADAPVKATARNGISMAILKILDSQPKGVAVADVCTKLLAQGYATTMKKTNSNLGNMLRRGHLRRVRPGVFASKGK